MSTSYYDPTKWLAWALQARTDAEAGAEDDVSGEDARVLLEMFTEGVVSGLEVSERGAGANMSVDVSVGSAVVEGANTDQGKYLAKIAGATAFNVEIDAADVSNPRIDEVYLVVQDDGYDSSGNVVPRLAVRDGTPASSPSAPGPDGAWDAYLLLASIAVAANETQIEDADITDERVTTAAAAGTVQTVSIADDAVTTAKIAGEAVTASEIAAGAVGGSKLADAGVFQVNLNGNIAGAFILFGVASEGADDSTISTTFESGASVVFTKPASWTTATIYAWGTVHFSTFREGADPVAVARVSIGGTTGTEISVKGSTDADAFLEPLAITANQVLTGVSGTLTVAIQYAETAAEVHKDASTIQFVAIRTS